jgi:O-acetylhomoserine (thiol)-lyase
VYYVKGAFLAADAAFEVIQGMRTLEVRMLAKCINTHILTRVLSAHPQINVHSNALPENENSALRERLLFLGLPAPLFTIDIDGVSREAFQRFFDALDPTFSHMISLGQSNTIVSCPAFTTHSELDPTALAESDIRPTTIRFAVGDEDPQDLISHFVEAARLHLDAAAPGFSAGFLHASERDAIVRECYLETHRKYIETKLG